MFGFGNREVETHKSKTKISRNARISKEKTTERLFIGGQIATSQEFGDLPNPNRVLSNSDTSPAELYENMMDDSHIYACTEILMAAILRHQWKVESKNAKHKKALEDCFNKNGNIRTLIKSIALGRLKGISIHEIVWEITPDGHMPVEINPLLSTDFTIDRNGFVTHTPSNTKFGEEYKHNFLIYRNQPYLNPYGVAELLKCYYPWQFKRSGWKFWMTTAEKYGVPTIVVEADLQDVDEDQVDAKLDEVAMAFFNADSDTVIVTNGLKDNGIHVVEAKAKADDFEKLINKAESDISKVIVGTHTIMDSGAGGSRAQTEVSANINLKFKVQETMLDIISCVNTVIDYFNFFQTGTYENKYNTRFLIPYVDIQVWEKTREAIDRKIPVSLRSIYQHIAQPEDENDVFIAPDSAPDKNLDEKKITPETKTDTGVKTKDGSKKDETRVETSQPGKQNTGNSQ